MAPICLTGQVALITGASSGIGYAIAKTFADAGAMVVINYHSKPDPAEALAQQIRHNGNHAVAIGADVSNEQAVNALFSKTLAAFGRLDILVANSGLQQDAPITEMNWQTWNTVIQVNLGGQFLCARAAIRQFLTQGIDPSRCRTAGKIIHISSVHETIPWSGHANYCASKGGVNMLMRSLAQEVAGKGIRVNSIAPGAIATPINAKITRDADQRHRLLKLIPYGRLGATDDVAQAALWLASDASDYVVGTTLYVDGGMCLYPEFTHNG